MSSSSSYQLGLHPEIVFDPGKHCLIIEDENHHLEPLQSRLLQYFIQHRGQVLSTEQIAANVWDRKQVSDNLVRQVISNLRKRLNDKQRPYRIIQTIPKQGYLFSLEVTERIPDATPQQIPAAPNQSTQRQTPFLTPRTATLLCCAFCLLGLCLWFWISKQESPDISDTNQITPVVFHDIILDSEQDYEVANSVFEYLFFGLNSSKQFVGYRHSQLTPRARAYLQSEAIELRGRIKQSGQNFELKITASGNTFSGRPQTFELTFSRELFFESIGDLILDLKTLSPTTPSDFGPASHRITSIDTLEDWKVIAKGISLFYQGKITDDLNTLENELNNLRRQGRNYYLLDSLGSYIASMRYLNKGELKDRHSALNQANRAFEKNPRCNIANTTLGLALLLNQKSEQAYPYLFYAAENSPSPLSFYLLSVADHQSNNPKGAKYNYQRFKDLNMTQNGKLFELNQYLQSPNLSQTSDKDH